MKTVLIVICFVIKFGAIAQIKIGDNPGTIDNQSIVEIESTTKTFVPPRMTTVQMNAISTPLIGSVIFNTDEDCLFEYKSSNLWVSLCTEKNAIDTTIIGTTTLSISNGVKDTVPGLVHTFTPLQKGILMINAKCFAVPASNGNSSQGAFYMDINGAEVSSAYYSTADGEGLVSLSSAVPLTYTKTLDPNVSVTVIIKVKKWNGNVNDQVNPDLSVYSGANAGDSEVGKTTMSLVFIPVN